MKVQINADVKVLTEKDADSRKKSLKKGIYVAAEKNVDPKKLHTIYYVNVLNKQKQFVPDKHCLVQFGTNVILMSVDEMKRLSTGKTTNKVVNSK